MINEENIPTEMPCFKCGEIVEIVRGTPTYALQPDAEGNYIEVTEPLPKSPMEFVARGWVFGVLCEECNSKKFNDSIALMETLADAGEETEWWRMQKAEANNLRKDVKSQIELMEATGMPEEVIAPLREVQKSLKRIGKTYKKIIEENDN